MQTLGLVILNQADEFEKAKEDTETFKRALAARSDFDVRKMWPEYFKEAQAEETDESGIAPDDYRNVEWKSPKDSPEEWEEMMKLLSRGALSGDEVTGQTEPTGEVEWTDWR